MAGDISDREEGRHGVNSHSQIVKHLELTIDRSIGWTCRSTQNLTGENLGQDRGSKSFVA